MQSKERAIVLFSGRFPSEKADSLFAHENARAFSGIGVETILLAPRRFARALLSERPYRVVYLPTIDVSRIPIIWGIANYLNLFIFSLGVYVWLRKNAQKNDFILCNEPLPLFAASYAARRILFEIHVVPKRHQWFYRWLLSRITVALPITDWNAQLPENKGIPPERILVARSAVDITAFTSVDKKQARTQLALSYSDAVAVYTGHLFGWKGVDTLAEAARMTSEVQVFFVGGTAADIERFKQKYADVSNIHVIGFVPHAEIPIWQAAADILVLPNSGREAISRHFTSPMKLFEYMASERPILASDLPSIREVLSEETGYFAEADDPRSFATGLRNILKDPRNAERRARAARKFTEEHTWEKRARRIIERVHATSEDTNA